MTATISKSKLKARMLEIFRDIEATGDELIVTDHGRPVLKIVPLKAKDSIETLFGEYQGQVVYKEDIDTPTIDEWGDV